MVPIHQRFQQGVDLWLWHPLWHPKSMFWTHLCGANNYILPCFFNFTSSKRWTKNTNVNRSTMILLTPKCLGGYRLCITRFATWIWWAPKENATPNYQPIVCQCSFTPGKHEKKHVVCFFHVFSHCFLNMHPPKWLSVSMCILEAWGNRMEAVRKKLSNVPEFLWRGTGMPWQITSLMLIITLLGKPLLKKPEVKRSFGKWVGSELS